MMCKLKQEKIVPVGKRYRIAPGIPTSSAIDRMRIVASYCSRESARATGLKQETDDDASALR
jgi:hypothetical protein